jgi:hypothetical protein
MVCDELSKGIGGYAYSMEKRKEKNELKEGEAGDKEGR